MKTARLLAVILLALSAADVALSQTVGPGSYWLRTYGLADWEWDIDHDNDSYTTREEYASGTDPFDPMSRLTLGITADMGNIILRWDSFLGVTYQVLGSPNMTAYTPILGPVAGTGAPIDFTVTPPNQTGFYRLSALSPVDEDNDGLSTLEEALLGTFALVSDSDRDGVLDGDEVHIYGTNPTVFSPLSGAIQGTAYTDPNHDGNLADGVPMAGAMIFLDGNFNGVFDAGERSVTTGADGRYTFLLVPPGIHHARQVLPAPSVQTFPEEGAAQVFNMLPDEVVNYTHAAAGVGNFDVPYGENASNWPANWGDIESTGLTVEPVASVNLVLKPIGVRNKVPALLTRHGSEFLSLPQGAHITLRFDEVIVNGAGPDFLIHSINVAGAVPEQIEVFVGPAAGNLTSVGTYSQALGSIPIDLGAHGIRGPVQFVKCVSLNNGGDWFGFELVGMEALNIAPPDTAAHIVTIVANETVGGRDFGRYFRDLPPTVILSASDNMPGTAGLRAGETITVRVAAYDDLGIASRSLKVNGQTVALNSSQQAVVPLVSPGEIILEAVATDSGGQTSTDTTRLYVLNADGSFPFDPNRVGQGTSTNSSAPRIRILSPGAGEASAADASIIASITGNPAPTSWTVEYAEVDDIDPYNLAAADADYTTIGSGTGEVFSAPVATMPLSTLPDGIYFIRITAQNAPLQAAYFGQVIAKNVPESALRPQVTITSPASGAAVTMTVNIQGTIVSTRPLREWYAEYARADLVDLNNLNAQDSDWVRFASGAAAINAPALIANFDGTLLKNNGYIVRIVAWNDIGLGWAEPLALEVTGEAKLGRNRLDFTDMEIDLAGFPLRFKRTYDSLQADQSGDLGHGWSLDLQDADIRETVPDTGVLGLFGSTPFRDGTRVYVTAPTGERFGFTFRPVVGAPSAFGPVYKATFEADPGVYHRLEIPEGDRAFLDLRADGNVYLFFHGFPWNPEKYVLIEPGGKRFTFHEDKGLLRAEDLHGNAIALNDGSIEHSSGLGIRFTRDPQGRITTVTAPDGNQWHFGYNGAGDLVTTTDPEGRVTTYSYLPSPAHYLSAITDPLGRMPSRFEYDPVSGRLSAIIDEHGNRREQAWNPAAFSGTVTSARGFVTTLAYNDRGNVTSETDPLGNVTTYAYNDAANPDRETSLTDAAGHLWRFQYNAMGMMTLHRPPVIGAGAANGTAIIEYDSFGNVTRYRSGDNRESLYTYDSKGKLISQRNADGPHFDVERGADGRPRRIIESDSYGMQLSFDGKGQFAGLSDNLGFTSAVTTSRAGQVTAVTDANGRTSSFTFDSRSFPKTQTDSDGDGLGTVENPDGSITVTDRAGRAMTVETDAEGKPTEVSLPGGGTASVTRNASGKLASLIDPLGNVTSFGYDALERMTSVTDPAGGVMLREYDSRGLLTAVTSPSGKRRTFQYDANRHLIAERWLDGGGAVIRTISLSYAASGVLTGITDTAGASVSTFAITGGFAQPSAVEVTYPGQTAFTVAYTWGRESAITTRRVIAPRQVVLRRGFTQLNRIIATRIAGRTYELDWFGGGNTIRLLRNSDGSLAALDRHTRLGSNSEHSSSTFTYHPDGSLARIRHLDTNGALVHPEADLTLARGADGGIMSLTWPGNTASAAYDAAGRLASVTHSNPAIPDETYSYDLAGNRLSSHLLAGPASIGAGNRLLGAGTLVFTYDADGNVASRTDSSTGVVTEFSYDHRGRLVLALVRPSSGAPSSATIELDYDFADRLVRRTINGATTWIINDRSMPIGEFVSGATDMARTYFYSLDRPDEFHAMLITGIGERWFLHDHLGTVRGVLDDNGALVSWTDYDSFGNLLGAAPEEGQPRHAGRFFLNDIGIYENRRRSYDPQVGRFLQPDPIRFSSGDVNLYGYVGCDPLNRTDPSGLSPAIDYASLVSLTAFYADNLCKLGACVGGIWKGVTEGVVNVQQPSFDEVIKDCTIGFMGLAEECSWPHWNIMTAAQVITGPPNLPPLLGGTVGVIGAVDSCHKMTFDKQIIPDCPPSPF